MLASLDPNNMDLWCCAAHRTKGFYSLLELHIEGRTSAQCLQPAYLPHSNKLRCLNIAVVRDAPALLTHLLASRRYPPLLVINVRQEQRDVLSSLLVQLCQKLKIHLNEDYVTNDIDLTQSVSEVMALTVGRAALQQA